MGVINQLITGGHHPVGATSQMAQAEPNPCCIRQRRQELLLRVVTPSLQDATQVRDILRSLRHGKQRGTCGFNVTIKRGTCPISLL